jgi:hypothetical protein
MTRHWIALTCLTGAMACTATAQPTLVPMTSFGGGDGWRAPTEVLTGDSTGGTSYSFLGTASNERGFAFNPATGNLILVSRSGGINIRILNGTTGVDTGSLANGTGIITGGTFAVNMVGVSTDGSI